MLIVRQCFLLSKKKQTQKFYVADTDMYSFNPTTKKIR
jgi:hypothetical protein